MVSLQTYPTQPKGGYLFFNNEFTSLMKLRSGRFLGHEKFLNVFEDDWSKLTFDEKRRISKFSREEYGCELEIVAKHQNKTMNFIIIDKCFDTICFSQIRADEEADVEADKE